MLRILQVVTILMMVPMMCLGLMAGLSGGGMNPSFQKIGGYMLVTPLPTAVVSVIIAEVLWRSNQPVLAYVAIVVPFVIWGGFIIWLQVKTGFFF